MLCLSLFPLFPRCFGVSRDVIIPRIQSGCSGIRARSRRVRRIDGRRRGQVSAWRWSCVEAPSGCMDISFLKKKRSEATTCCYSFLRALGTSCNSTQAIPLRGKLLPFWSPFPTFFLGSFRPFLLSVALVDLLNQCFRIYSSILAHGKS